MQEIMFDRVLTLDGGFGTALEKHGLRITGDPLWNARALITNPDLVVKVHKEFILAGANVISTNSYHANIEMIQKHAGMTPDAATEVVKDSVRLVRRAISELKAKGDARCEKIIIAGAIGPYATTLHDASEYSGHYVDTMDDRTIINYFVRQARPLLETGVDVLGFETVPAVAEARCILKALDELPECKAWISFSCKEGDVTNHGESFATAVREVSSHERVIAIGINCTAIKYISSLVKSAQNCTNGLPFVVYPNSGEIYKPETGWTEETTEERRGIDDYVREWIGLNIKGIGGCCRVSSDDIRKIADAIQKIQ
uniref:Hcy-binding domain-containing protein n=1 Tax=Plectus sambesii TaxID=2011161 RepID=A0A914X215_9BILA